MLSHPCWSKGSPLPATDLSLLIEAARRSGEIAADYFGQSPDTWDKPDNAGPVTAADLAVDVMLQDTLRRARPDYGWLSEETEDDCARLERSRVFVVDPIDGTRAFINGSKDWAHSLAVVEAGQVTAAVVYLPMRDMMFVAARGGGATLNDAPIGVNATPDLSNPKVLTHKANFDARFWKDGQAPAMKAGFRSSLAYRLCLVANGHFDAMLTLRPTWEWDVAAGTLIVQEAGGIATQQTGAPVQFNNPHPQLAGLVAGGPVHALLVECIHCD